MGTPVPRRQCLPYASIVFHLLTNTRRASSYAADILRPEDNSEFFILERKITMSNRLVSSEFQYQGDIAKKNVGWLVGSLWAPHRRQRPSHIHFSTILNYKVSSSRTKVHYSRKQNRRVDDV